MDKLNIAKVSELKNKRWRGQWRAQMRHRQASCWIKATIFIVAATSAVSLSSAPLSEATLLRMGPMAIVPIADGTISRVETYHSSVQYGPVSSTTGCMMLRYGTFHIGYTEKGFYLAARTSLPTRPQKLADSDQVTFSLQPPTAKSPVELRVSVKDGTGVFPDGVVVKTRKLKGVTDYGALCAETEMFVPYSAIGVDRPSDGERWGVQMRVDYSSEAESGFWHLPAVPDEMGTLVIDSKMPIVGLVNFDYLECWRASNTYMISHRFDNVSDSAVKLTSRSVLKRGFGSAKLDAKAETASETIEHKVESFNGARLAAGEYRDFMHMEWSIWPGSVNVLETEALANGEVCYRRRLAWEHNRGVGWKDESGNPTLDVAFYPSVGNRFVAQYHVNKIGDLVRGNVQIANSDGKIFFEREFVGRPNLRDEKIDVKLGDLPIGDYLAKFVAVDANGREYDDERTFEVKKFAWQGNLIGKDRVIIPPFTPIHVKGAKTEFLQTSYNSSGLLWDEIYAEGENILAAPVNLILNGKSFDVKSSRVVSAEKDRVVREVTAECEAMKLTVTQDYDYDGFCLVTFAFEPESPVAVESLHIVMPLRNELVSMYNACGRGDIPRSGPEIDLTIPGGEGEVWNSDMHASKWEKAHFNVNFQPYLWVGDRAIGLCWLMENMSSGYSLDRDIPMQRLVRAGGAATLSSAIVNKRTVWDRPVRFRMGFQPTPVKPRSWGFQNVAAPCWSGYACPSNATFLCCNGESAFQMDTLTTAINTYPGNDKSFLKWVLGNEEPRDVATYHSKLKEYVDKNRKWFEECAKSPGDAFVRRNWTFGSLKEHQAKALCCYFNPLITSCYWPEYEMYKSEWGQWNWPQDNHVGEYDCKISPSRIDKLMYDANTALDDGYMGIYFDCFGCHRDYNYVINPGNAFLKPNGDVQMSVSDLLSQRELVKRAATLCHVRGLNVFGVPYVEIHTTDCMVVPVVSFGTVAITQERGVNGGEYHVRYPESFMIADTVGIQAGLAPCVISYAKLGDTARRAREFDTLVSYICAFGIFSIADGGIVYNKEFDRLWNAVFDFGWGKAEVTPHFSFDRTPAPVTHTGKDIRMTLGTKKGAALMLFGNLGEEVVVEFDLSGLNFKKAKVTNVVTGEVLAGNSFRLRRHGYAAFLVEEYIR